MTLSTDDLSETQTSDSAPDSMYTPTLVATPSAGSLCPHCTHYTPTPQDNKLEPENDLEQPLHGWPELSKLIADNPGFEAFPVFRELHIKSLLYYQAELDDLRTQLHRLEWKDHRDHRRFDRCEELSERVDVLLRCRDKEEKKAQMQINLITKIRKVLKEYNTALIQYSQITALPEADPFNVETLRRWLRKPGLGSKHISGPGSQSWGDLTKLTLRPPLLSRQFLLLLRSLVWSKKPEENKLDLIVPRSGQKVDGLTRWVADEFVPFWQNFRNEDRRRKRQQSDVEKRPIEGDDSSESITRRNSTSTQASKSSCEKATTLNTYSGHRMLQFTSSVATIIACVLPTAAITVLSKLDTTAEVLGVIALFTVVFAAGLMFLTDAGTSRVEIFTATAAFSAVMVVFVQNQNGGSYQQGGGAKR